MVGKATKSVYCEMCKTNTTHRFYGVQVKPNEPRKRLALCGDCVTLLWESGHPCIRVGTARYETPHA